MIFRRLEGSNGHNGHDHGRGRARWIGQAAVHIGHQREGRTSQPLASKNQNTEMAGRGWPGGTGLWRGERPDRTRPHESAHLMHPWIEHAGGITVARDSRAHLKAWSNRPSWKISLHTKTNPTSPLVGLPEAQKLGCRLDTSPRAGSKTSKSTGKLGSFVFLCVCVCLCTNTHKHTTNTTDPYFFFVCVCVCGRQLLRFFDIRNPSHVYWPYSRDRGLIITGLLGKIRNSAEFIIE